MPPHPIIHLIICSAFAAWSALVSAEPNVHKVGPDQTFIFPSVAAEFAKDGDIIEIDAKGMYLNDHIKWNQNNLTIRGVGGRAILNSNGLIKNGKAIWVFTGDNVVVENIEFSGARVNDKNGAGIRMEGAGLIVRNCVFYDNENGLLVSSNSESEILVENSEFRANGAGSGQTHNMYIGTVKSFTLKFSYSHHAIVGHNVKSRAKNNFIMYNRIMDEELGRSSYAIDLPEGGSALIIGNIIQQGEHTENNGIISFAAEKLSDRENKVYLIHNTIVNDRSSGVFVKVADGAQSFIFNNIFAGKGKIVKGNAILDYNVLPDQEPGFISRGTYDYHLRSTSPAIDKAKAVDFAGMGKMAPEYEYIHPMSSKPRHNVREPDLGAFEFSD